jgi:electron transfer flavoprotein alpha/beta subunit
MSKQIYELEDILDTYTIENGLPVLLASSNSINEPNIPSRRNKKDIADYQIRNDLLEDIGDA